jgi:serine/threonine protein kinase
VKGGELFDELVNRKKFHEQDAARVIERVLSAIGYCHDTHNVIHRDLRPENILVDDPQSPEFEIKVIDFSISVI